MRTRIVPLMAFVLGALLALAGAAAAQDEDPNPTAPRWAESVYEISLGEDLEEIRLDGEANLHKVQTSDRRLQRQCGGSACSADDLRTAYQRAGETGKQRIVDEMEARIEARVEGALAGLGATGVEATANVSEASLAEPTQGAQYQPPIPIDAEGSGVLSFVDDAGVSPDQVGALFEMGARVDKEIQAPVEAGTNLTLTLAVPAPLGVLDAREGAIGDDGRSVTWTDANWKSSTGSTIEDEVRLGDPTVVVPNETDASVEVTLDVTNVSVRYGNLLGDGEPADARVSVSVDGSFASIENPRSFDRVELEHLSADAVRIALENGLLERSRLIDVEDRAREQIRQTFAELTGEQVDVTGGFPAGALSADEIGDPAGTGDPIELRLDASSTVPFPPEQAPAGASGFTVTTLPIGSLELPDLGSEYDVDTVLTIVLPEGLDLAFDEPSSYEVSEHEVDGRKAYTFASNGQEASGDEAAVQNGEIVVEHPFVWNVFWPLILALVLLLVVLPAVVIGLTIRRRRKRGPPTAGETSKPVSGSQATQRTDASEE